MQQMERIMFLEAKLKKIEDWTKKDVGLHVAGDDLYGYRQAITDVENILRDDQDKYWTEG